MKRQYGFSLIELMISTLLASFIMILLVQHYLNCKRQYKEIQTSLDQEYEMQLVTELLRNSIRQAGFTPCVGIGWLRARDARYPAKKLLALDVTNAGRQVLKIERMSEQFSLVTQIENAHQLRVEADQVFRKNQAVVIADCFHAEIVSINQIRKIGRSLAISLQEALIFPYTSPTYLGEWLEEEFFVQKNTQGKPALFYRHHHAEELSRSIIDMHSQLYSKNQANLLQVKLALENKKEMIIETALRIA